MSRQVIHVKGLGHGEQPIPLGVKIGNMLFTGSIGPNDPETGKAPDSPEEQIANTFRNIQRVLDAAGANWGQIAKVDVRLSDRSMRNLLNKEWVKYFPNEEDRPARHTAEGGTGGGMIQAEIIAILS